VLESAEVGHAISRVAYARQEPALREALLNAQYDLSASNRGPVLMIVSGVEGGGRSETANRLTEWMDPRHIRVTAFGARTGEERARPPAWRYWRMLPPRGTLGIFMNAWYTEMVQARLAGRIGRTEFEFRLQETRRFEQMLVDEGVVLLKFWIHLPKAELGRRLAALARDPRHTRAELRLDRARARVYQKLHPLWEEMLRESSTADAPWVVVEGTDARYREITVGRVLLQTMTGLREAKTPGARRPRAAGPAPATVDNVRLMRNLDRTRRLTATEYDRQLAKWQRRLYRATQDRHFRKRSLVLAFEGVDAAGKGGAIRRVTGALDARQYVTIPVAAPTDEERRYPYLWRFWRHVPARGGIAIFDRTWYGRVLVERVEGYCSEYDWRRAYDEINQFEEQLADGGAIVCKFWLQISRTEQLRRFRARERTSFKRFKITEEDWRNRGKWERYEQAVADMVDRTSTEIAPWTLVEAEDKFWGRVKVLKTIVRRLEQALG
jgi:polyphosphate:AMP phosphotransferase